MGQNWIATEAIVLFWYCGRVRMQPEINGFHGLYIVKSCLFRIINNIKSNWKGYQIMMMGIQMTPQTLNIKRVMIFIDGGYLRNIVKKFLGGDPKDDPQKFVDALNRISEQASSLIFFRHSYLEIIRIYYYDGQAHQSRDPEKYKECEQFFKFLKDNYHGSIPLEQKYGRLTKRSDGKYEQKGVDVFLSVDMVVKAFQDHYDLAILIAGDDDFVDAVKNVKDLTGKRIIGLYKPEETSQRLIDCLDYRLPNLPKPFFKDNPI